MSKHEYETNGNELLIGYRVDTDRGNVTPQQAAEFLLKFIMQTVEEAREERERVKQEEIAKRNQDEEAARRLALQREIRHLIGPVAPDSALYVSPSTEIEKITFEELNRKPGRPSQPHSPRVKSESVSLSEGSTIAGPVPGNQFAKLTPDGPKRESIPSGEHSGVNITLFEHCSAIRDQMEASRLSHSNPNTYTMPHPLTTAALAQYALLENAQLLNRAASNGIRLLRNWQETLKNDSKIQQQIEFELSFIKPKIATHRMLPFLINREEEVYQKMTFFANAMDIEVRKVARNLATNPNLQFTRFHTVDGLQEVLYETMWKPRYPESKRYLIDPLESAREYVILGAGIDAQASVEEVLDLFSREDEE